MEYVLILAWGFLAATILPIGSEPYYMGIVAQSQSLALPLFLATLGNTLGGMTTFLIGRKGGNIANKRMSDKNKARYERARQFIKKYGPVSLVMSWIPIVGDILVTIGGVMKLPVQPALFWMTLGKFFRYFVLGVTALGLF